jgi:hypothetical protein
MQMEAPRSTRDESVCQGCVTSRDKLNGCPKESHSLIGKPETGPALWVTAFNLGLKEY